MTSSRRSRSQLLFETEWSALRKVSHCSEEDLDRL